MSKDMIDPTTIAQTLSMADDTPACLRAGLERILAAWGLLTAAVQLQLEQLAAASAEDAMPEPEELALIDDFGLNEFEDPEEVNSQPEEPDDPAPVLFRKRRWQLQRAAAGKITWDELLLFGNALAALRDAFQTVEADSAPIDEILEHLADPDAQLSFAAETDPKAPGPEDTEPVTEDTEPKPEFQSLEDLLADGGGDDLTYE